jgi:hypothetical protein
MEKLIKLTRFTTLPVLLDLLERRKLVLLDPESWDDKNDTQNIQEYKRRAGVENLFALCFTHKGETIHHWKSFAGGATGCCIEFSAGKLISIFEKTEGLRHGMVTYKNINSAGLLPFSSVEEIPFTKRKPYQFEREYRAIWTGRHDSTCFELELPLDVIRRITFTQQMPDPVFRSVKALLIRNYKELRNKVNRSTLYKNERWIGYFKA